MEGRKKSLEGLYPNIFFLLSLEKTQYNHFFFQMISQLYIEEKYQVLIFIC